MQNHPCHEEEREILTNAEIKTDLKKRAVFALVRGICLLLCVSLIILLYFYPTPIILEEWPTALILSIPLFLLLMLYTYNVALEITMAIMHIRAVSHNRFYVQANTLIDKKQGRRSLSIATPTYNFLLIKPNCYRFAGGTYKTAVDTPQYRHSKHCAMNGDTLFRRSHVGDSFWVVSLKNGKPVKMYPADLFDYRDTSPL